MSVVRELHVIVNAGSNLAPAGPPLVPDPDIIRKRLRLIDEEYKEVRAELIALTKATDPNAIIELYRALLKELADLRYVVEGTAVTLGLPIEEAFAAVHESNLSKFSGDYLPPIDKHGKFPKGPNYQPPDMAALVPDIIDIQEAGS